MEHKLTLPKVAPRKQQAASSISAYLSARAASAPGAHWTTTSSVFLPAAANTARAVFHFASIGNISIFGKSAGLVRSNTCVATSWLARKQVCKLTVEKQQAASSKPQAAGRTPQAASRKPQVVRQYPSLQRPTATLVTPAQPDGRSATSCSDLPGHCCT